MNKQHIEQQISEALDQNHFCTFATVEGNKPKLRYMVLFHDGLNIHLATSRKTHKVEELEQNPNVSLLCGYEKKGTGEILDIQATAAVTKDESLRQKIWNDELKRWFDGPDDPDYVILDITPTRIEYNDKEMNLHVWES
ncbi:pyridoxamine 5'-phosphate oxidase family protein [Paenibacillus eucommiae]|uniref:General stress protein 26 n=1 Tax=Paenibacillus eucommiae TaxID=1355755 RepID=A0ABS4ITB9_9BACL|nr:pyridoxamine 5'-phosphate oxidase family protein [Paenibacillus eucommiae]MBP1990271.1 general stress protein 26 [Paenibacillus eucommiae]